MPLAPARRAAALAVALGLGVAGGACGGSGGDDDRAATPADLIGAAASTTTASTATTSTTAPSTTTSEAPTTTTTAPTTTAPAPTDDGTLRPGEDGPEVAALQARLVELGYWLGEPDGSYGRLTEQAVLAFQKAEGLQRDGIAGPATRERLAVATRPAPHAPADGIEIDLERQILLVVRGGAVELVLNTSTGTSGWRTPPGTFAVDREIDGVRRAPLGDLYRPKYFNGGIAVHGSPSIPAHPASHGCARVTNAAMDMLWSSGFASIGTEVRVL